MIPVGTVDGGSEGSLVGILGASEGDGEGSGDAVGGGVKGNVGDMVSVGFSVIVGCRVGNTLGDGDGLGEEEGNVVGISPVGPSEGAFEEGDIDGDTVGSGDGAGEAVGGGASPSIISALPVVAWSCRFPISLPPSLEKILIAEACCNRAAHNIAFFLIVIIS